ncbi:GIY-YIG nuclease family protein [Chlorogloeopsis sp. ULAP01]|uniref:GIY-YIG nuclease family protein n=1 Tax=Chlorogloeopsis sp. ULAP01 TaxID=3056483 RepID=UPI0025AAEEAC|nr:GIY-YIG nuclease family protein [Chlorogloeopsis sp. ULAP01]MDM9381128.1 GIY-YIG nuclease family protein [Chlorogloeopsis sp. ULAP01]
MRFWGLRLETHQLDLFSLSEISSAPTSRTPVLLMDEKTLTKWKSQITIHQQQVRASKPTQQATLFQMPSAHIDPGAIDPFNLSPCSLSFYRLPTNNPGEACLYFVIDIAANLLLYIGETCKSNKRWKGVHDCKQYIENYLDLHYRYELKTAVNIAFWWDAPTKTRSRQRLELTLIQKWKSPFNKENWRLWGQPFG